MSRSHLELFGQFVVLALGVTNVPVMKLQLYMLMLA